MDFPDLLKETTEKEYAARSEASDLTEAERRAKFRRSVRVSARYTEGLRKELRAGEVVWYSDAAKAVGGKGEHPGALSHFVAGLPLCQMTHYAERAAVEGIRIDELAMDVVARYVGMSGYAFDEVEYTVKITSSESPDEIRGLASKAAGDCYVTNTLRRACRVQGHIFLNEKHVGDL